MADKQSNVVLNFKMSGQVEYAQTIQDINAIMNAAAQEYKTHVAAMGKDGDATQKLAAEKQKLEIQLEAGRKRTEQLRKEYEAMAKDTNTSTRELANKYRQLQNSERAEIALERALNRVNEGLTDQAIEARKAEESLNNLESEAEGLERQTQKLNAEYELQKAQLGENASEADKLNLQMEHLNRTHELAREQVRNHEQQLEQARIKYGENSEEVIKYETQLLEARTAEQQLANEIDTTNRKLKEQEGVLDKTTKALGKAEDKIKGLGKYMTTRVTAPIVGAATASVMAFREVDESLDDLATNTGATGKELEVFHENFRNVAKRMPFEMMDIANAIGDINTQFGFMGDKLEKTTERMLKFVDINDADVSASVMGAKQAIESFNMSYEDLEMVLDSVAYTAQNTGADTNRLFDSVVRGAPQLKELGLDFAQAVWVMGRFAQKGIEGTQALGYLTRAHTTLAKDGKTLEEGLAELTKEIENNKDETEQLALASEMFGTRGASVMLEAIKRGALDFSDLSNAASRTKGTVEATFEETLDPIDQFRTVMNNLKFVGADLAITMQELLNPMIEQFVDRLKVATEWFRNLTPEQQKMIISIGGIAAAVGPVLVILGTLIGSLKNILGVLPLLGKAIGLLVSPVGLVVAAVAGLIAIFVNLYRNNEEFREKVHEIWENIKEIFSTALEFITNILQAVFGDIINFFGEQFAKIRDFWQENGEQIIEIVKLYFGMVWEYIKFVFEMIKGVWQSAWSIMSNSLKVVWESIKLFIGSVLDVILGIFNTVLAVLRGDWEGAWNSIKKTVENIWNNIVKFFENVNLFSIGKDIIQGLINGIGSMVKAVGNAVKNVGKRIKDTFTNFFKIKSPSVEMRELGQFITEGLGLGIEDEANFAVNKTENVAYKVSDALKDGIELPDMEIGTVLRQPQLSTSSPISAINNIGSNIKESLQGLSGEINVHVYLDTNELNAQLAPGMSKQLNNMNKFNARSKGVMIL